MSEPRAAVYSALVGDSTLSALGIGASNIFASNATDDPPATQPFLIIRWEETENRWGMAGQEGKRRMTIWAHDHGGSYGRINAILDRTKDILEGMVNVAGSDGVVLTQADWRGASPDLVDDGFHTLTRNHGWEIIGRKA